MRVLVVATPLPGHVLPLLPLASALRDAGHEVAVATAGDAVAVCPPGTASDVAPGLRLTRLMVGFALRHPAWARREAAGRGDPHEAGQLWAPVNERMAEGVGALADRFGPDLVLHEPFAVVGAQVAARLSVPAVVVDHSLFDSEVLLASVAAAAGGGPLPPPAEILTTAPTSLVGARHGRPMRFVPPGVGSPAPEGLPAPGPRARVFVSRSTVAQPGRDRLMSTVLAAGSGSDVELVLVRPDASVTRRPLPPGVLTTEWVAFPAVLPAAAGLVHHGGAGTLMTALSCGVPQLVFPGAGDRRVNAGLLTARGAGLSVELPDLDRATLERLARDGSLREAAAEVAAEMAAMPHPSDVVPVLAGLAATGRESSFRRR